MLAQPARRATYHRALRSGELIPQNEWELRRSAGSGMLKGDPLTRGAMLALPITSSGEWRTHSSEWKDTQPLRRERHTHRWPSGWGEQCWLYQQRALGSGTLIPRNEWTFRRSEGSGILIGNAGSTYNELWRVENSFLRMKRHSAAQKGAAYS